MSPMQRVIKLLATVFAVILAVSIVSAIIGSILGAIISFFPGHKESGNDSQLKSHEYCLDDVREIIIESDIADMELVTSIDANEESVTVMLDQVDESHEVTLQDGCLRIKSDKRKNILSFLGDVFEGDETVEGVIKVVVPSEQLIENTEIKSEYGSVKIRGLHSEQMDVSLNTGNVTCEKVVVKKFLGKTEIGEASFKECRFTNAEIMGGAGDIYFEGMLLGNNHVKGSVGKMKFNLHMKQEDCSLDISNGMGNVYIDGQKYEKEEYRGNGADNHISVDVGMGNINFNFES